MFDGKEIARSRPDTERRLERRRFFIWAPALLLPTLGALAVVWGTHAAPEAELGVKGDLALRVFAVRGETALPVAGGDRLGIGERLRFEVNTGGLPYLLVISIDAGGHTRVYVPYGGSESVAVDPDKQFVSPGSLELEPVLGSERVFAIASREPILASAVEPLLHDLGQKGSEAIRRTARLPLSSAFEAVQRSFLWEKVGR